MVTHNGTYVSRIDDGRLETRNVPGSNTPEPESAH